MVSTFYKLVLLLNVLWFGMGFWYFCIKRHAAAKLLIPESARSSPVFLTMTSALPFLGGMNFAFALLAAIPLLAQDLFVSPPERSLLLIVLGVAHATQFVINIPVAIGGGRLGESYWDVLKGPMLFIFVVDALMMMLNLSCAVLWMA